MIEKIKYAIFDMDGTIADSLGFFDILWREMGTKYFGDPSFRADPEFDKYIRTKVLRDASDLLLEKYSINDTKENFFAFCDGLLLDYYINNVKPKPGAIEFLDYLRSRGVKICVASATEPRLIKISLEKCGLTDYFEFIISCTEVGVGKEKPDVFLEALRRLGGDLSSACVFEDSFVALETAKKAGFMTVGVYDKSNYEQQRLENASNIYISSKMTFLDIIEN